MCTEDQHKEKIDLLKDLVEGRTPLRQIYSLSANQVYELDYKERKHIFVWPLTSFTLTLEEYGNLALTAQTWTELSYPQGLRITASGQTNSVQLYVLCTDDPIDVTSGGGGGGGGGAVTVADGADVAQGATTDAAVTTDASGTLSGKIRGLVKIFNSVWDGVGFLFVKAVQSGAWSVTANAGTNLNTSALALESGGNLATIAGALSSSTSTKTSVNAAASDTSLLASNASRKGGVFFNDSTAILYLSYGSGTASTTSYTVQIPANGYFELPPNAVPTVAIRGIWSAANGAVRITELT